MFVLGKVSQGNYNDYYLTFLKETALIYLNDNGVLLNNFDKINTPNYVQ